MIDTDHARMPIAFSSAVFDGLLLVLKACKETSIGLI